MSRPRTFAAAVASLAVLTGAATLAVAEPASAIPPRCNPRWNDCPEPTPTPPPPPAPTTYPVVKASASLTKDWGDFHQSTYAVLKITKQVGDNHEVSAELDMTVHTWNDAAFWGFHATSSVVTGPAYWPSDKHTYGVTPTVGDTSDRYDTSTQSVPLSVADNVDTLYITETLGG